MLDNTLREKQKGIQYHSSDFTVESLLKKVRDKELSFSHQGQTPSTGWTYSSRIRYVTAVLFGIPVPVIPVLEDKNGRFNGFTNNGMCALLALYSFTDNQLQLRIGHLPDYYTGFTFKDLPKSQQKRFMNRVIKMFVFF